MKNKTNSKKVIPLVERGLGRLYIIQSDQTPEVYVGSTFEDIDDRFKGHIRDYKSYTKKNHSYTTSFEIVKYDDCYIELISEHENISERELLVLEGLEILKTQNTVNKIIPGQNRETPKGNGKIYIIKSNQTTDVYIGSTFANTLARRLIGHRSSYQQYLKNNYCYVTSFKLIELSDCHIELISEHGNITGEQLRRLEGIEIQKNPNKINKIIPGQTRKERDGKNKDILKLQKQKYRNDHMDKINIYNKQYKKQYNEKNKDKISEKTKETTICACGCEITIKNKNQHERSIRHQNFLKTGEKIEKKLETVDSIRKKEKITCECGSVMARNSKYKHYKDSVHQNYLKTKAIN